MTKNKVEKADFEQVRASIKQMNEVTKLQIEMANKKPRKYFVRASNRRWVEFSLVMFTCAGVIALLRAMT